MSLLVIVITSQKPLPLASIQVLKVWGQVKIDPISRQFLKIPFRAFEALAHVAIFQAEDLFRLLYLTLSCQCSIVQEMLFSQFS